MIFFTIQLFSIKIIYSGRSLHFQFFQMSELGDSYMMDIDHPITVVGGGLSGTMIALLLSRRGMECLYYNQSVIFFVIL